VPAAEVALAPEWLLRQRWFRAKRRGAVSVELIDRAPLAGAAWLGVLGVGYRDGGSDRYLLPAVSDGGGLREPRDGEGAWRAVVRAIAEGSTLAGQHGRFECDPTPALSELLPSAREASGALAERRLGVEQTNTSVVLGERLLLKLYRLLEPGANPDLEVSAFLTDAGFGGTPAAAGSMRYLPPQGEPCAAAMLSAFVASDGDAWHHVLGCLATDPTAATAAVARIGALTARLHAALASRPATPGFPARPATDHDVAAWADAAERQADLALDAADGRLDALASRIRERLAAIGAARGTPVSRVHGDYHLGQLLAAASGDFVVIDFEGEPARPLERRREVASPLRDVAGMLRSLDYAAHTAERGRHVSGFHPATWLAQARSAFLGAYGAIGPDQGLLAAFEVEKACYEVAYEANHRPDWIWLPLEALQRLVTA